MPNKFISKKEIPQKTKIKAFKSIFRPVLIYGYGSMLRIKATIYGYGKTEK